MNSSERRIFKRKLNHTVTLYIKEERYFQFDDRMETAKKFCKRKCKGFWFATIQDDHAIFTFQKESDAVYFGLIHL